MTHDSDEGPEATDAAPAAGWAVDLDVAATLTLPGGATVPRDEFFGWLWAECGDAGLLGIGEGTVGVGGAAARGLGLGLLVVDAAAAPPDRDWVGSLDTQTVCCWFADEPAARRAADLLATVTGCRTRGIRPLAAAMPGADWRDAFAPIEVPGFGVVRPAWEEGTAGTTAGRTTLFIEPGCGFGTGEHETTRLCLAALAAWVQEGGRVARVLDFGSGSGILGIAAAVRGADRVTAVEIDRRTHDAIRDNCRRNGVQDRVSVLGELPAATTVHDLVFANIVPAVLLEHAERLRDRLGRGPEGSCLVLSGLRAEEVGPVAERYARLLAAAPLRTTLGDWHCLRFVVGR
jgi:ribosomal protein L11 methyltransferase